MENAISEQNAATETDATPASTDSAAAPVEVDEDAATASREQSFTERAVNAVSAAASGRSASSRPAREPQEAPEPKPTVYIGNLFFDVTENDLNKEFSRFGTIQNTRLIRDARGLSKGLVGACVSHSI